MPGSIKYQVGYSPELSLDEISLSVQHWVPIFIVLVQG